ncbi:NAD(P)-dependent alcohol dehydrogenase [Plectonema cf. radiosum LEGE 06105]|uniref:NAD(P)-dependent alcohol dehydrogenase n=1 Tax=Plectonema cf. radiosum LEGE 06105 TaxID=945769 RepID=A0A8J7F415_9CYAN|nr:NAD(P)-dependent alcohol dehydrogenase [Plectonema radiosum]MBE9214697.1 NAD(P)-dependent alcohol dehydrogenase [Plectonema cf. radiosum LEGE 06105]
MRAIAQTEYGSTDVLRLIEIEKPKVPDNGVLVRVYATSVNAGDWHLMRGEPFLIRFIFGGLLKPKIKIIGCDVAGRVEAVGKDVTQFQLGDEVFGDLSEYGFGAFAEYVCTTEAALVLKPANMTFEEAATVPTAALSALQGLRDCGQIQSGQKVLINGASGGVGSFAVQIAKAFGAEVTAVCSTKKMEMVRTLGADHVIDYTQTDVTQAGQHYNLVLDAAAYRSVFDYLPILTTEGAYIMVGGSTARLFQVMFFGSLISKTNSRRVQCLVAKPNQKDLTTLKQFIEAGKITTYINKRYNLSEIAEAISHLEQRQVLGKVAISV